MILQDDMVLCVMVATFFGLGCGLGYYVTVVVRGLVVPWVALDSWVFGQV